MKDDFRPQGSVKPAATLKETSQPTQTELTPFLTPEQISLETTKQPPAEPAASDHTTKPRGTGHHWFNLPWPPNRQEIILIAILLVAAVGGIIAYVQAHKPATAVGTVVQSKPVTKKPAAVQATTVASTLSGLPVSPEVNQRPVVGAMIENSQEARPQAGLSQAGVVFEAVAEGGVTRFLALFQDQQPTNIGPVRSARPYYVQWDQGFDAVYAHVGGSPDALNDIKNWGVKDLNQFANSAPYHRVSSRPSPHNMYASVTDLTALAIKKGYGSKFTGFTRKAASPAKTPNASSINFNLSAALYNPHYSYDSTTNSYLRSEGGSPQTDANTSKQLAPNVVIAIVVPLSRGALDASGAYYSNYNPIGSGSAYIFQDGTVTTGTWSKASNTAQISFTDAAQKPIALNPGQTWITAVTGTNKVSYQ